MITERPKAAGGSSAELELEKAVRGFREPMPDEVGPSYWGIGGINAWDWAAFKGDPQSERTVTVGNAAQLSRFAIAFPVWDFLEDVS